MSTKINVMQRLAEIKAMKGDKNKIDTAEEQYQFSILEQEVLLNPQKYSYEDRQKIVNCKKEISVFLAEKKGKNMQKSVVNSFKPVSKKHEKILNRLEELGVSNELLNKLKKDPDDETIHKLEEIIELIDKKMQTLDENQKQLFNREFHKAINERCGCSDDINGLIY